MSSTAPFAAVAGGWPLEVVRVDREPWDAIGDNSPGGLWRWYFSDENHPNPAHLPTMLIPYFDRVQPERRGRFAYVAFPSRAAADLALSNTLIAFARDARSRAPAR